MFPDKAADRGIRRCDCEERHSRSQRLGDAGRQGVTCEVVASEFADVRHDDTQVGLRDPCFKVARIEESAPDEVPLECRSDGSVGPFVSEPMDGTKAMDLFSAFTPDSVEKDGSVLHEKVPDDDGIKIDARLAVQQFLGHRQSRMKGGDDIDPPSRSPVYLSRKSWCDCPEERCAANNKAKAAAEADGSGGEKIEELLNERYVSGELLNEATHCFQAGDAEGGTEEQIRCESKRGRDSVNSGRAL